MNDTTVDLVSGKANPAAQGGTATYCAGFINFLLSENLNFGLIGNFNSDDETLVVRKIHEPANLKFLIRLMWLFLSTRFSRNDILYFQRPDHLAVSIFCPAAKVVHFHGSMRSTMKKRKGSFSYGVYRFLEHIAIRKAKLIIATDQHTASIYQDLYPKIKNKICIIPAGFDVDFFQKRIPTEALSNGYRPRRLLYLGRLAYPKRVGEIIAAFTIAAQINQQIELHIAGDGKLLNFCKEQAAKSGVGERIYFHGKLNKVQVRDLIHRCDAGILLSHSEGSPISVKEMLACGKPVIVNNVGDVKEYIHDGITGYVVDPENFQQVAEKILDLLTNPAKFAENTSIITAKYSEMTVNKKVLACISNIGSNI